MGELSRQFQDYSGLMNQRLAQVCDEVTLVVAGLPLPLKQST
jgi:adenosylcobinamide kinase/adenosylcobinamide-phosphate guanylyltransferase